MYTFCIICVFLDTQDTIFLHGQNFRGPTDYDSMDTHVATEMSDTQNNPNTDDNTLLYAVSGIAGVSVFLLMLVGAGFFLNKYKYVVSTKQSSIMQYV